MAGWDGNGNVTVTFDFTDERDDGTPITASQVDQNFTDVATALENCMTLTGETTPTASIPMGTQKFTGLGDGTALTDSVSFKQLQNNAGQYATAAGSSNAYTLTLSPVPTAYAAGQVFAFKANHTNTGSSTLNVNSLGATTIKKDDGSTNLAANDIISGQVYAVIYDGTNFQILFPSNISKTNVAETRTANVTFSGAALDMNGNNLFSPDLEGYTVDDTDLGNVSGTVNIDMDRNVHVMTLTGNITSLTFSNLPASLTTGQLVLVMKQDGTGSRTISWPSSIKWAGSAPVLTSTASATDIFVLLTFDGGTTYAGQVFGQGITGLGL